MSNISNNKLAESIQEKIDGALDFLKSQPVNKELISDLQKLGFLLDFSPAERKYIDEVLN